MMYINSSFPGSDPPPSSGTPSPSCGWIAMRRLSPLLVLVAAACSPPGQEAAEKTAPAPVANGAGAAPASPPPVEVTCPPACGAEEEPGPAEVLRSYFAHIENGRFDDAWRLWSDGGRSSGMSREDFAASFGHYGEYRATIGTPGRIEGAAGSLYVEVPVIVAGRLRSGEPVRMEGMVQLRRCNDVPGCTAEQLRWRIAASSLQPQPVTD